ncbi:MAG: alanine--tRNA ligase [Euryarchaeota archaeon]|nr:alanine--tRNA ligase [Euryarchaeota archaeon]
MPFGDVDIPFWSESGHHRKNCIVTNLKFWTRDEDRETCGDSTADPYTFIGNPIIKGYSMRGKELKDAMRKTFLSYFSERNHTIITPYPVIARWRDDIHLTIASIADFQPHVTSGQAPPPANPLTISQPCIRLTDVAAVGRSGRHLSTFEMMAHHAFNRPKKGNVVYWIDQCVRYCDDMLIETFKIPPNEITYVENPWSGGGNAGPALEVIVGGLELATLVFMNLEEHDDGDIEIKGIKYREMELQIIDTGYGLERFCWAAAGTPNIYEAIYPESVNWLKEITGYQDSIQSMEIDVDLNLLLGEISRLSGILNIDVGTDVDLLYDILISRLKESGFQLSVKELKMITEPLSSIYAIPDHMHAICNMLGDGLVPSNAKAGYLLRMLARRVCRMKDIIGVTVPLAVLGSKHIENYLDINSFIQSQERIFEILELEERKYYEMLRKGESAVKTALKDFSKNIFQLPDKILFRLSEERGLSPEMAISIANSLGWNNLSVRVGFSADMAARNAIMTKNASKMKKNASLFNFNSLSKTSLDYYQDTKNMNFDAQVIDSIELSNMQLKSLNFSNEVKELPTHAIILDRTLFYPEGGGQLGDQGFLMQDNKKIKVFDTKIYDGMVLHFTNCSVPIALISGSVNWARRKQLMDHHTAIHIVGGATRELLGPHIWQAGSNKGEMYARLDVTHYSRISRDMLDKIEDRANEIIIENLNIEKLLLNRGDADKRFNFDIYQGGPPKYDKIRIIKIGDFDIQACGGTHRNKTGLIGELRIIRSSQVQDGVERLQVVAGDTAREHARFQEQILSETSDILGINVEDLPKTVLRFFEEWKSQQKRIEELEGEIVRLRTTGVANESSEIDGVRYVIMEAKGDSRKMMGMLGELTRDSRIPTLAILGSREGGGKLIVACTENSLASTRHNAVEILNQISIHIDGGGGGKPSFAQGGGSNANGIPDSLSHARKILGIK